MAKIIQDPALVDRLLSEIEEALGDEKPKQHRTYFQIDYGDPCLHLERIQIRSTRID